MKLNSSYMLEKDTSIKDITDNNIFRSEWFVGSSLMSKNFEELPNGRFFYFQDTIWSKILDMPYINPYWEIHNRTENFLFKNQEISYCMKAMLCFIEGIDLQDLSIENNFYFVTSDQSAINYLEGKKYHVMRANLPFYLGPELAGDYLKVFYVISGKIHPLIDCTLFCRSGNSYFEINSNSFYVDMIYYFYHGIIPKKYKIFSSIFDKKESYNSFYLNQDNIRVLSLLDCVLFLSEQDCMIDSSYRGHSTKKIIKDFVFYTIVTGNDISKVYRYLKKDFCNFIILELKKIKEQYPEIIKKNKKDLAATYGIDQKTSNYLHDVYVSQPYILTDECNFFTDLPFLTNAQSFEDFCIQINQIIERKQ